MVSITESIATGTTGMHFGNRLIFPFHCELLKIIIEDEIITDFSRVQRILTSDMVKDLWIYTFSDTKT